jgi:hypothetical protein
MFLQLTLNKSVIQGNDTVGSFLLQDGFSLGMEELFWRRHRVKAGRGAKRRGERES